MPECRGRGRGRHAERRPARRAPYVPLSSRAGGHVLVPHAPGLLEGGAARSVRRVRHRASRENRVGSRRGSHRAHVRRSPDPGRPGSDRPAHGRAGHDGSLSARQLGLDTARLRALDGLPRPRHRRNRCPGTDVPQGHDDHRRRRRTGGHRAHRARRSGLAVDGRCGRGARAECKAAQDPAPRRADSRVRPRHVRQAGPDAVRRVERLRPQLRAEDHAQARLLRRSPGTAVGDQR